MLNITDYSLENIWNVLVQEKLTTTKDGKIVIDSGIARRIYVVIGRFYNQNSEFLGKTELTKEEFEKMYTPTPAFRQFLLENLQNDNTIEVVINWSKGISVDDFDKQQLSDKEKDIVQTKDVIYIFEGTKYNNKEAIDAGQTSRALSARTKEHIKDKDFLEGYPYDRYVYCGEVSCGQGIDRDLLEQVEGAIIGCLDKNKGARYLCNDKKRDDYKKPYRIKKITNKCIPVRLRELLPESFVPEKE